MKEIIKSYVKRNFLNICILTLFLFIGLILGVVYINNIDVENKNDILSLVDSITKFIREKKEYNISEKFEILKNTFFRNIIIILILGFVSSSIIGIPLIFLIILFKGFSVGCAMSSVIASIGVKSGIIFICSSMLIHNIINISGMYIVALSGISLYKLLLKNREESIRFMILKHMVFLIIAIIMCILASLVETFFSNYLIFALKSYI